MSSNTTSLFLKWMMPLAIVWGFSFALTKIVSQFASPMIISTTRVGLAFIFFYMWGRGLSVGLKQFINGLFNFVGLVTLLNLGVYFSSNPGLVAVMIYTSPLFVLIIESILGLRVSPKSIIGVLLGVIGIISSAVVSFDLGLLFGLVGGITWAIGTVYYRKYLTKEDVAKLNAFMSLTSLPIIALTIPIDPSFHFSIINVILLIILALLAQVAGFYFWFNSVKYLGSVKASVGSLLVPVFAYVFSYLVFKTIPSPLEIVGSALTLIGVYLTISS